jgi:tetraacyldisaccharide 4'-kinase
MNFNNFFLTSFRVVLLPLALLYGGIIYVRNWLYNKQYFKSAIFNFPLICVGNIAVGGTGKSPMVEYLVKLLQPQYKVATLSRGYKRKTKGYVLASEHTTALEIGDEPMQFHTKFPNISVAVGEERLVAIPQLLHDKPTTEVIILDDAFQHRSINAGFNILLTEYSNLYSKDFFLPTGDLRDSKHSANRAQMIVVTKCPPDLTEAKAKQIKTELGMQSQQYIYFTSIAYGKPYHIINTQQTIQIQTQQEVLLVCGIANPKPLKAYLHQQAATYYEKNYSDHHIFSIDDLKEIKERFEAIDAKEKLIITTEKDAVRLIKFNEALQDLPLYVLPIEHRFLFNQSNQFDEQIIQFVQNFATLHHT